jgi:hypothetical protein
VPEEVLAWAEQDAPSPAPDRRKSRAELAEERESAAFDALGEEIETCEPPIRKGTAMAIEHSRKEAHFDGNARLMTCTQSREGWHCTRGAGHEGPCAAIPATLPLREPGTMTEADVSEAIRTPAIEHLARLGYEEFRATIRDGRREELARHNESLGPYPAGPSWEGLAEIDRVAWRRASVTILLAFDALKETK